MEFLGYGPGQEGKGKVGGMIDSSLRVIIRAQQVQWYHSLYDAPAIEIEMWLNSVGGSTFVLAHDFWAVFPGSTRRVLFGRALVTCIVLRVSDNSKYEIPGKFREMITTMSSFPAELVQKPVGRPSGGKVFKYDLLIRASDMDRNEHVNQAKYLDFFDDVRFAAALCGGYGDDPETISLARKDSRGVHIDYKMEAIGCDRLEVFSWLLPDAVSVRGEKEEIHSFRSFAFEIVLPKGGRPGDPSKTGTICTGILQVDARESKREHSIIWKKIKASKI
jgi:acyl-CoA thioesterase FadM